MLESEYIGMLDLLVSQIFPLVLDRSGGLSWWVGLVDDNLGPSLYIIGKGP